MANGLDTVPFAFQAEVLDEMDVFKGRVLLALDPGLGKTFCALRWLRRHPEAYPALVICPASVKFNWELEAHQFNGLRASICESQSPPAFSHNGLETRPKITIINHDILRFWIPYLEQLNPRTIIIDESQNFIHAKAKRTKAAMAICKGRPHVQALSGTPLTNRPSELWPTLHMLWPKDFASYRDYAQSYCAPRWTPWGWDHSGAANLDVLHQILKKKGMIRRRKEDVLKDLPNKVWRTVPCELVDPKEYHEASTDFTNYLKKHGKVKALKVEKLTRVGFLLRLAARLKMRGVVEWANKFLSETDEKLILFAIHHKAVDVLQRRIEFKSCKVDGSVTGRNRQAAIEQFKKDPATRLFLGSAAAGVGVNGLQVASEVGVTEFPWRPADITQWVDRAHRIGQKETVFVNLFVALGTIEEDLVAILRKKQGVVSAILDGGETPADLNIYEELLRVIEGRL